jgi:uncharacterized SAM-binding protein YcdF (DUF218 family)
VLPGVQFSAVIFAGLAGLCVLEAGLLTWSQNSRAAKLCNRILLTVLGVAVVLFCVMEGFLLKAGNTQPSGSPDAVIVLGAGVNGSKPSLVLQSRINAAADYLKKYPDIPVVLSGGRGPGESVSEASAIYHGLVKKGIDTRRLILDETSFSTSENIKNSLQLLKKRIDLSQSTIALVTSDFHVYRACSLCESMGVHAIGVPAKLSWWWLDANYYTREAFAVGKMILVQVF